MIDFLKFNLRSLYAVDNQSNITLYVIYIRIYIIFIRKNKILLLILYMKIYL